MNIKISKSDWQRIGVKMGWMKKAQENTGELNMVKDKSQRGVIPSLMSKIEALESPVMTRGGYKVDLDEVQENPLKAAQRVMAWAEATGNNLGHREILNRFLTSEVKEGINQKVDAMGKSISDINSLEFKEKAGIQEPRTIREYLYNEMLREIFIGMQTISGVQNAKR